MPLPFLIKHERAAGMTTELQRPQDEQQQDQDHALLACAKDMMAAASAGDALGYARALKAAFEIMESQPHEEGPHIG